MTRNGVPSPADFRHCMEACEVASHVSRRFPTSHLKNGSCSFPVENLNRSQGTKRKRSKEADSSPIIVFKHISSTESEQDPQKSSNIHAIYHSPNVRQNRRLSSSAIDSGSSRTTSQHVWSVFVHSSSRSVPLIRPAPAPGAARCPDSRGN